MMYLTITFIDVLWALVIGVIGSAIVTFIYEAYKRKADRYHLSVSRISSQLYVPQSNGDVKINVEYNNKSISTSLVVMQLLLHNDGKKDIKYSNHFSDKIRIHCKHYNLIAFNVNNNKAAPCFELVNNEVLFSWDILKKSEVIAFELVAERKDNANINIGDKSCYNSLEFDFRADCLDKIETNKATLDGERNSNHYKWITNYMAVMSVLMFLLLGLFEMATMPKYQITLNDDTVIDEAVLMYNSLFDKYIIISDNNKTLFISSENMCEKLQLMHVDKDDTMVRLSKFIQGSLIGLFFMIAILTFMTIRDRIKEKRHDMVNREQLN